MELEWFDDGRLNLLLADQLLGEWHGSDSSDYERACLGSGNWLNLLSVGGGFGLILGGDTGMVLVASGENDEVVLVRWVCADNEHELVAFALCGGSIVQTEPDLVFDNPVAQWRIFNAAANPRIDGNPSCPVILPIGKIRAQTAYQNSMQNAAIVHRFSKIV